jgi:hypothetical protein
LIERSTRSNVDDELSIPVEDLLFTCSSSGKVDYFDQEHALCFHNMHIMDLFETSSYIKSSTASDKVMIVNDGERQKLFVSLIIDRIDQIDIVNSSFEVAVVLFTHFLVDLDKCGMGHLSEKANKLRGPDQPNRYSLFEEEWHELQKAMLLPEIGLKNLIDKKSSWTATSIWAGTKNCNMITTIYAITATLRHTFPLHAFPVDTQHLPITLINDRRFWRSHDLTVMSCTYMREALSMTEFEICIPTVRRNSPPQDISTVYVGLCRYYRYYLEHIIAVLFGLEVIGLVVFLTDPGVSNCSMRASIEVTLLLTIIALKFSFAGHVPCLHYNTLIDTVFSLAAFGIGFMTFLSVIPQFFGPDFEHGSDALIINVNIGCAFISFCFVILSIVFSFLRAWFELSRGKRSMELVKKLQNERNFYTYIYCTNFIFPPNAWCFQDEFKVLQKKEI